MISPSSFCRMRDCRSFLTAFKMLSFAKHPKSLSSLSQWLRSSRAAARVAPLSAAHSKPDWDHAIAEAERVAGYSDSYFSLRCLLSDEMMNVAMHLRKLSGINHPLLQTAKRLTYITSHSVMQTRGLIVLLIAKSAADSLKKLDQEKLHDIHRKQTSLAEMTEIINHAYTIHTAVVNISPSELQSSKSAQGLHHVNKMSVLLGDFLLASVMKGLGEIRNVDVVHLMSTAISDYMEGQFMMEAESGEQAADNPVTKYWEEKNFLRFASLQANSCRSVLVLADHSDQLMERGYEFGKNFSHAWQAFNELQPFLKSYERPANSLETDYDVMSAPVLLHFESNRLQLNAFQNQDEQDGDGKPVIDYQALHHAVSSGVAINRTKDLIIGYSNKALDALELFTPSESVKALADLVYAVREV